MPKMKSKSAAKKRFKATATGKITRRFSMHSHILTKKRPKRKNRLTQPDVLNSTNAARIKRLLPGL